MQALGCLGNVLWFFPFGLGTGLLWCIAGVFCFISIIGIPWGRACFVMAGFAFMPFGRMPVSRDVLRACLETHLSIMKRFNRMLAMAI